MKPFLIVAGNFVETGGMDRANLALARYLADIGRLVHLVGFSASENLLRHKNITFHRVPKVCNSVLLSEPLLDIIGRKWASDIEKVGGRVVVNGGNCHFGDINWVHYVHRNHRYAPATNWDRQLKSSIAQSIFEHREKVIVPKATVVIVPSRQTQQDLVIAYSLPESKIKVVPLGIDNTVFRPANKNEVSELRHRIGLPQNRLLAYFSGGFDGARKGFDSVFAAWEILCKNESWNVDLVVVGDGPDRTKWSETSINAGLNSRIHFLGFRTDVADILRSCDVSVLPSRYETYSLSTQEAICCGLPSFISASTGIAESYPPELRELLIPNPDNVPDLVQRLTTWQSRHSYYREVTGPFTRKLSSFTWEKMAELVVEGIEGSKRLGIK